MEYTAELILKYFADLSEEQMEKFTRLEALYADWNSKINVISRKDFQMFYLHHVLHSLAIAKVCSFKPGARILDIGCGGGFPSVPLAIMFPSAHITAVDSIAKKIRVVQEVTKGAEIENLTAVNGRVEDIPARFDYVVSRAVAQADKLVEWTWKKIEKGQMGTIPNGMICLKGGELDQELSATGLKWEKIPVTSLFPYEHFNDKYIIHTAK